MFVLTKSPFKIRRIFLICLSCIFIQLLQAQNEKWKSIDWQLGIGNTYLFDSYLSPLPHEGTSLRFSSENFKPLKWGLTDQPDFSYNDAKWYNQFYVSLNSARCTYSASSSLLHGTLEIRNSTIRKIIIKPNWSVSAGGFAALSGGGRYCLENGNNPGSIDALFDIGLTAISDFSFPFRGKSIKLRYQGSLALGGLAFSPEYAESYYEIFYLKNHHNTLKLTSLTNMQLWKQQISMDIPLSHRKSSFRLSYWNEGRVSLMNNIRTRVLSSQFTVGYIRYFSIL